VASFPSARSRPMRSLSKPGPLTSASSAHLGSCSSEASGAGTTAVATVTTMTTVTTAIAVIARLMIAYLIVWIYKQWSAKVTPNDGVFKSPLLLNLFLN
jgi:hypothetical protein